MILNEDARALRNLYNRLVKNDEVEEGGGNGEIYNFRDLRMAQADVLKDAVLEGDGAWLSEFLLSEGVENAFRIARSVRLLGAEEREALLND